MKRGSRITWDCDRWRCCVLPLSVSLPLKKTRSWYCQEGKKNHGIWSINQVLEMPNTLPAIAVIHGTRTMFQQRLNANVHYKNDKSMCSKKKIKCTWTWVFKQIIDCVPAKYHMFQQFWALCGRNALWFFKPQYFWVSIQDMIWNHHHQELKILHSSGIWFIWWQCIGETIFLSENCIQIDVYP